MDLYEAMYTTRAMRRVKPDPIPEETIAKLFDAAVRGPSGGNRHTFRFLTVTDKETMRKIKDIYTCYISLPILQSGFTIIVEHFL